MGLLFSSKMLFPSRRDFSGVDQAIVGCKPGGCMLLLLLLSCVLARDITESRDGDGRAELCTAGEAWHMIHADEQNEKNG